MLIDGIGGPKAVSNTTVQCCHINIGNLNKQRQGQERKQLINPLGNNLSGYIDAFALAFESSNDHPPADCFHLCPDHKGHLLNIVYAVITAMSELGA